MLHSSFKEIHKLDHTFDENSQELRFLRHICSGGAEIKDFFHEKTAGHRDVCLHTPDGEYCGIEEIRRFSKNWLAKVGATSAEVHPVIQTIAGGRSVSEVEVWFQTGEDEPLKIPMAVFGDVGIHNKLEGMRIYYFYQWIPGTPAYNRPIFRPMHNRPTANALMAGVIRHYYEELHNPYTPQALENIIAMTAENVRFGGYRPLEVKPHLLGIEKFSEKYRGDTTRLIPGDFYIRFETITDDGENCLVEWTSIVRKHALSQGTVSQAGMAAYERNEDGKLASVRICDNFGFEKDIDYSLVLPENLFIDA
jgi:hypothetical protein